MEQSFGLLNSIVLFVYLAAMVLVGVYFSKKSSGSQDDYFKAGGRVPAWAAGFSIWATTLSAITFMATPAKAFSGNWVFAAGNLAILAVAPIVLIYFVPFFRNLNVTTAYEYLEQRFDVRLRTLSSLVFILFHIFRVAIVIYLPTLAICAVSSLNPYFVSIIIGILCIIYTFLGGIEGVIWSDVIQGFILLVGAIFIILFALNLMDWQVLSVVKDAAAQGKFLTADEFSFSLVADTVPLVFIGAIFTNLYQYIGSQDVVQRYQSTSSIEEVKKSLIMNCKLAFATIFLFYGMGTVLYMYYTTTGAGALPAEMIGDQLVPYFILTEIPAGIAGLIIAAIFAASQSTISSSLNSISACFTVDIYNRLFGNEDDAKAVIFAKFVIIACGTLGTLMGLYFISAGQSGILDLFQKVLGSLGGPVVGIFILGVFSSRTSGNAAFLGLIISGILVFVLQKVEMASYIYAIASVFSSTVIAYGLSYVWPNKKEIDGLTYKTLKAVEGA
ncbi:sodium:solute symporter [Mollicutes bacterium LVI A0039]|nr:sodium:solute symporter [Mollicutes bacterium LVI A0039]